MVKKSLVLFLVLSFVAVLGFSTCTNVCLAGDSGTESGEPGQINPGCEPVTPTPFILYLFWTAVYAVAGSIAAFL